ncbi:MAG: hypothetical protein IKU34_10750 [Clostridia bacterium]|nr:hypothetical protein [Clostridia bacterium]
MRLGCIGVGSNAIRLLNAQWNGTSLCVPLRERRGTRLFAGLCGGMLTQESMDASVNAVGELARLAREDGACGLFVFATSAVRDAKNGDEFTARASEAAGTPVEIITGEEEAILSYLGASEGGKCGVVDIGGGSTEFTLGEGARIDGAISLQMGAVRMHAQTPVQTEQDYEQAVERCMKIIRRDAAGLLALGARDAWCGVGGTMTTLGAMQMKTPLFLPDVCEGMTIRVEEVAQWGRKLSRMTLSERRQIVGLMPQRADIIPSGVAILEASMRCFSVREIRLSAHGNMDGFLKKKFREMY